MSRLTLCAALFCGFSVGCAKSAGPQVTTNQVLPPGAAMAAADAGKPTRHIRIWSEPHPLLDPIMVTLDGCREWWPNDVDCVVSAATDADIHVNLVTPDIASKDEADYANCVKNGKGAFVLAVAFGGGEIHFYPQCFEIKDADGNTVPDKDGNPTYNVGAAKIVMAHEVGHELGLPHVPRDCAADALVAKDGRRLCGKALMNPYINGWVPAPTEADDLDYEIYGGGGVVAPTGRDCTLYFQP